MNVFVQVCVLFAGCLADALSARDTAEVPPDADEMAAAAAAGAVPYQRHSQSSRVTLTWTPSSQQHMAHSLQQEVGRVVFNSWLKVATALIAGTRYWNNTWSFEQLVTSQN